MQIQAHASAALFAFARRLGRSERRLAPVRHAFGEAAFRLRNLTRSA